MLRFGVSRAIAQHSRRPASRIAALKRRDRATCATLARTAVLATVLPLLGLGRRMAYSQLAQLCILSQLACYALVTCPGSFELLPAAYITVG